MYVEAKSYDKYGIITGNKVYFRRTPYGTTMKDLEDGELVYFIKKEKQITKRGEEDFWCQIATTDEKVGWVRSDELYYLDESLIPEKYYIQIINGRFGSSLKYDRFRDFKFEYLKDNSIIIFKFDERDEFGATIVSEIYEIKDEKIIRRSPYFTDYNSKFIADENFIFCIESNEIEIFNRKKYNDDNRYVLQAGVNIPRSIGIDRDKTIIDFNKSENCYYLKIIVSGPLSYSVDPHRKSVEEIYKFDGKKLVRVK